MFALKARVRDPEEVHLKITLFKRLFFQPYSCDDLGVVQGYPAALHTGPNNPRLAEGALGDCTEVTVISSAKPDHNDLALSQSYCQKPNTTFIDQPVLPTVQ